MHATIFHPVDAAVDIYFAGRRCERRGSVPRIIDPVRDFGAHGAGHIPCEDIAVSNPIVRQVTRVVANGELIDKLSIKSREPSAPVNW